MSKAIDPAHPGVWNQAEADRQQLLTWVRLDIRDKIAFFEEMIDLAHASGALSTERLALRDTKRRS